MDKLSKQQVQAAKLVMDKLGSDWTKTVYYLEDFKTPIKIEDPNEDGIFFAESCYVVDIKSSSHRYQICWQGPKLIGESRFEGSNLFFRVELDERMSGSSYFPKLVNWGPRYGKNKIPIWTPI